MLNAAPINVGPLNIESPSTSQARGIKTQNSNNNAQKSSNIEQNGNPFLNRNLLPHPPPPPSGPPPPPLPINGPPTTPPSSYNYSNNNPNKLANETPKIGRTPSNIKQQRLNNEATRNIPNGIAIKKNAYAVFPSDSMLKKSLPRRSKKSTTCNEFNTKEKKPGITKNMIETNI